MAEELCASVYVAKDGSIWIGHQTGGVSVINDQGVNVYSEENGLVNNEVHDIIQAKDGKTWIATFGGIRFLMEASGSLTPPKMDSASMYTGSSRK